MAVSSAPSPPPRRTQAERVAESAIRLRLAFAELVAEQGYAQTTAAQIGERAGYSRAMVRERYGSKDALLASLHDDYEAALVGAADDPSLPGLERARTGTARLVAYASEHPTWLRAIFVVSFEAIGASPDSRPRVARWLDLLRARVAEWITAGQADGSVRGDLDADDEAQRIVDEAIGGGYRWVLEPQRVDYVAHLREWSGRMLARLDANRPTATG